MAVVALQGMPETRAWLDDLKRRGDVIARRASTEAADGLRTTWLVDQISGQTGISRQRVLGAMALKSANEKYPDARINFSGAGVLVVDYRHQSRIVDARHNRAQIIIDWIGGKKVAAGFINPRGSGRVPLSTRNVKAGKGRVYVYRDGVIAAARGPSIATAYLALPSDQVEAQAEVRLSERLAFLLDEVAQ